MDFAVRILGKIGFQLLDVGALLADHHARPGRVNGDTTFLVRALDKDARHTSLLQLVGKIVPDLDVFLEELAVLLLVRVPARIPSPVHSEPKPDRIDLLTHQAVSLLVSVFRAALAARAFRFAGALVFFSSFSSAVFSWRSS